MVPSCHENFSFTYNYIFFKLPLFPAVIMCYSKTNYYSFLGS